MGLASAPGVQTIASSAVEELLRAGATAHSDLQALADIGHHGEYPGNTRRDLISRYPISKELPLPVMLDVPSLISSCQPEVQFEKCPVLMPHELFHSLWSNFNGHFTASFADGLEQFWNSVPPDDPRLVRHPMLIDKPDWRRQAVPIVVHGDGVRFSQHGNNLISVQWSFLLSSGWGWDEIYFAGSFPKSVRCFESVHGCDTWAILWKWIVFGLRAGYDGIFPANDADGNPWAAGTAQHNLANDVRLVAGGEYFMVVWVLAADADFASNELHIAHHAGMNCCPWCPATLDNFRDVRKTSSWQMNQYSLDNCPPLPGHDLFTLPGMTIFHYPGDFMHTFHLGVDLYLHGGTIRDLTSPDGPFAGNEKARHDQLWGMIATAYDAIGITSRLPGLHVGATGRTGPGYLRAKASASKHLTKAMAHVLERLPLDTVAQQTRLLCYQNLVAAHAIIDDGGLFWGEDQADCLCNHIHEFLLLYNVLVRDSIDRRTGHFNFTVKFHLAFHEALFARYLNPKAHWCFKYENFIGLVQQCAESCTAGTRMAMVPQKLLDNYLRLLSIRLARCC